jgi:hypothetical protein
MFVLEGVKDREGEREREESGVRKKALTAKDQASAYISRVKEIQAGTQIDRQVNKYTEMQANRQRD